MIFFYVFIGFFMQAELFKIPESEKPHKPLLWIEKNIHFPPQSGRLLANQPVGKFLLPFQKEIIKTCLGNDGQIKKDLFLGWVRKVSKSMCLGFLALYLLEHTSKQMIAMASTYGQADVLFRSILNAIMFSPGLQENYKIRRDSITHKRNQSRISKIFNSAEANLGMQDIQVLFCDELSAFDSRENMDALLTGMSMGDKPLVCFTSNPPANEFHWSVDFVKTLEKDKNTQCFNFSAPPTDKINKPETWAKANPFVKEYLETENKIFRPVFNFYKTESQKSSESKSAELSFRRFLLGQKVSTEAFAFCDSRDLQIANENIFTDKSLRVVLACDLSFKWDFTAMALVFFSEDTEQIFIKPFLFLSNTSNRFPSQKNLFNQWHKAGYIHIFRQATMPTRAVIKTVKDFMSEKNIQPEKVVSDFALSNQWKLSEHFKNLDCVWMSPRHMTGSIRYLQDRIQGKKVFLTEKNDCAVWHFSCALVSDKNKNFCSIFKTHTHHSKDLVDCVTLATRYFTENKKKSFESYVI